MARNAQVLIDALENFLLDSANLPGSPNEAAQKFADAYDTYAQDARSCSPPGTPIDTTASKAALQAALATAFDSGTAAGAAAGIKTALDAYWTPANTFQGAASVGVAAPSTTGATFQTVLATLFVDNIKASAADAIAAIANSIHSGYTDGVVVTHPAPDSCTTPIT